MAVTIYTPNSFKTTKWSGGETVQFWIYPRTAILEQRNFEFRISSALVEIEASVFSNFDGYERKLMVLDGELQLEHEGHHSVILKPFDQDTFAGSWRTTSKGTARDFNVIYRKSLRVDLSHQDVEVEGYHTLHEVDEVFVYAFKGNGALRGVPFFEGDIVHVSQEQLISIHADSPLKLIIVDLKNVDK